MLSSILKYVVLSTVLNIYRPKPTTIIDGFVTQKEENMWDKNTANEKTPKVLRVKGDGLDGKVVQIVNIK